MPYHAELLYLQFKVGFVIISLQAKESKHSGVKQDLNLTNRSRSASTIAKWWQWMHTNYVRAFTCLSTNQHPLLICLILSHVFLHTVRTIFSFVSVEDHLMTFLTVHSAKNPKIL